MRTGRIGLACGVLLLLGGCRTSAPPAAAPSAASLVLDDDDIRLAGALARYAEGLIREAEHGGVHAEALAAFHEAFRLDPSALRVASRLAVAYLMERRFDEAIAVLRDAAAHNPASLAARLDLALALQLAGRLDEAAAHYRAALAEHPTDGFILAALARLYLRLEDDRALLETLRAGAPYLDPTFLPALAAQRGRQKAEAGALDLALEYYRLLADSPARRSAQLMHLIGQLYIEVGRIEAAMAALAAAIEEDPPLVDSFLTLGMLQADAGRPEAALATLAQAEKHFAADIRIRFALALAHSRTGDHTGALDRLTAVAAAAAETGDVLTEPFYLAYAVTAEKAGRAWRVEPTLRRCLERHPDAHATLNYLAYLWAEDHRNLDEALAFVDRALALDPGNGAYIDTRAWILYRQGHYEEALETVLDANRIMPGDPVITDHVGDVYDALGRRRQAIEAWSESLRGDPDAVGVRFKLTTYGVNPRRVLR